MKLTIETTKAYKRLDSMFGLFFEDLNHAADGGLYAEMVQNRSFEACESDHPQAHALMGWEAFGHACL